MNYYGLSPAPLPPLTDVINQRHLGHIYRVPAWVRITYAIVQIVCSHICIDMWPTLFSVPTAVGRVYIRFGSRALALHWIITLAVVLDNRY